MPTATATSAEIVESPDLIVGIDTHKDAHVAVALSSNGARLGSLKL